MHEGMIKFKALVKRSRCMPGIAFPAEINWPFCYPSFMLRKKALRGLRPNRFREYEKSASLCFSFQSCTPCCLPKIERQIDSHNVSQRP